MVVTLAFSKSDCYALGLGVSLPFSGDKFTISSYSDRVFGCYINSCKLFIHLLKYFLSTTLWPVFS